MNKKFITLTTDYGYSSFYTGILKGHLFSLIPNAEVIDLSHEIPHYNIIIGAFILKNSYKSFPDGTIHIIDIKGEKAFSNQYVMIEHNNQYFIGADNGLFPMVFDIKDCLIYKINVTEQLLKSNFRTNDILVPFAAKIANEEEYLSLVTHIKEFNKHSIIQKPFIDNNEMTCSVLFVDNNYNAIVNISKEDFYDFVKDRDFEINIGAAYNITKISSNYYEDIETEDINLIVLFGSTHNMMEIVLRETNAAGLLGLNTNSKIIITRK